VGKFISGFFNDLGQWSSSVLFVLLWVFYEWARQLSRIVLRVIFCDGFHNIY
jgi:hypothetical protein